MNNRERERQRRHMQRILDEGIKPHATRIAEVCFGNGGLAVVVFELDEKSQSGLRQHGWRGEPVFPMPETMRRALTETDHITGPWVAQRWRDGDPLRILLVVHQGSLLVNYALGRGFYIEPGSTDAEVIQ
jgi:hypothetical protein